MTIAELKQAALKLTPREQEELLDFVENVLEDRLELTDEFKAEIEAAKAEVVAGAVRVRKV